MKFGERMANWFPGVGAESEGQKAERLFQTYQALLKARAILRELEAEHARMDALRQTYNNDHFTAMDTDREKDIEKRIEAYRAEDIEGKIAAVKQEFRDIGIDPDAPHGTP
jgi:hypothetical protein